MAICPIISLFYDLACALMHDVVCVETVHFPHILVQLSLIFFVRSKNVF